MTIGATRALWRSISTTAILLEAAHERGCPAHTLLAGTGIRSSSLADQDAAISFEQEYRMIRNLLRHSGDAPGIGLEIGMRYHFTSIAPLGFALVSSPTFRSAFDVTLRYADLNVSLVEVMVDGEDRDLRIGFREERLPPDLRQFAVERTTGAAISIMRDLVQQAVTPHSIEFNWPRPKDTSVYRTLTGTTPTFDRPKNLLILKQRDVDLLLERRNPLALRMAEEQCQRYLAAWKKRGGLAARVREIVALRPRDMPSQTKVASILCMSERTLRRRLQEEGTHFSALCDETRQAIAEQLLTMQRLPVEQIAERLGYSETAAFIHAFKRWRGQSPHAYRLDLARSASRKD
jgi:AraC-like DNA-binding protein